MRNVPSLETVYRDYKDQGVQFYYIYKSLAHPENNGYIDPVSLKERLMHITEAKRTLGTEVPWLCDSMQNDLKHALGNRPNSEFIVGPDGKFVVARDWSNPERLRADLEQLVGKVESPTRVADLDMRKPVEPKRAPTGIVPRVQLPGQLNAARVIPVQASESGKTPHYVKLRAEIGSGNIYLGFFLDPLYKVHWNNQAPPMKCELTSPDGITLSKSSLAAEKVEEPADADPREFLVEYSGRSTEPIRAKLSYFACDDAETFCDRVEQEYLIYLERDPDGGRRFGNRSSGVGNRSRGGRGAQQRIGQGGGNRGQAGRGSQRPPGNGGGVSNRQQAGPGQNRMSQMLSRFHIVRALDVNQDGEITSDEMEIAAQRLSRLDRNRDGKLSRDELVPR